MKYLHTSIFEVFTAMNIQVQVFWVVMSCNFAVGY